MFPFNAWRCRICGRVMPELEYTSLSIDVGCPKCGVSLNTFRYVPKKQEEEKEGDELK